MRLYVHEAQKRVCTYRRNRCFPVSLEASDKFSPVEVVDRFIDVEVVKLVHIDERHEEKEGGNKLEHE